MRFFVLAASLAALLVQPGFSPPRPAPSAPGRIAPAQAGSIPLDMLGGWYRRDWDDCRGASRVAHHEQAIHIVSESSAVKYWQVPTLEGGTMRFADEGWLRNCDRPRRRFVEDMLERDEIRELLIPLAEYPLVRWGWGVAAPLDDSLTADGDGRIRSEGDDFAAKIGFQLVPADSLDLREIAYVWTRDLPAETLLVQETRILFLRWRFHRLVARSGQPTGGPLALETMTRDLYADYKRIWPDEEPGRILRVFLMTDGDNTGVRAEARYADLTFLARPPR